MSNQQNDAFYESLYDAQMEAQMAKDIKDMELDCAVDALHEALVNKTEDILDLLAEKYRSVALEQIRDLDRALNKIQAIISEVGRDASQYHNDALNIEVSE